MIKYYPRLSNTREYQIPENIKYSKRVYNITRDYQILPEIIKLSNITRDYQILPEIVKYHQRLSDITRDYQILPEIHKYYQRI